jgi:hypothetical protein
MLGLFGSYALRMTLKGVTYGGLFEMLCALLKEVRRPREAAGLPMGAAQTIPSSCVIGMWTPLKLWLAQALEVVVRAPHEE